MLLAAPIASVRSRERYTVVANENYVISHHSFLLPIVPHGGYTDMHTWPDSLAGPKAQLMF